MSSRDDSSPPLPPPSPAPSILARADALRAHLSAELRKSTERATAAAVSARSDVDTAVHEYRKALRKARSIVRAIGPALRSGERKGALRIWGEARRAVSLARDHAVAPTALASVSLDDAQRALAEAILADAAVARPLTEDVAIAVGAGSTDASAQAEVIDAALPASVSKKKLLAGIGSTYRAGRRSLRGSKKSASSFHRWRRRTKELVHQLELLADHSGDEVGALRDRYVVLSSELGRVVDIFMLRDFLRDHGHRHPEDQVAALIAAIETQAAEHVSAARKLGKDLFDLRRKRFVRYLKRAVKRDLSGDGEIAEPAADGSVLVDEDGA